MVKNDSYRDHMSDAIRQHEGLVKSVASRFAIKQDYRDELMQVGRMALFNALQNFDPEREVPFKGYAWRCIFNEMITFIRQMRRYYVTFYASEDIEKYASIVECDSKDTEILQKLMQKLSAAEIIVLQRRFGLGSEKKTTLHILAKEMGVSHESIRRLEKRALKNLRIHLSDSIES